MTDRLEQVRDAVMILIGSDLLVIGHYPGYKRGVTGLLAADEKADSITGCGGDRFLPGYH